MNKDDNNVVDFTCLKIQTEIEDFYLTRRIPASLKSGEISIRDIQRCLHTMDSAAQAKANKLIHSFIRDNRDSENLAISEYNSLYALLKSRSNRFYFARVLDNYRPTVNPLTAFYYECREMKRTWDSKSDYHKWLLLTIQDKSFAQDINHALAQDLEVLHKFVNRYYWLFVEIGKDFPVEIYHAKQLMEDFEDYREFFAEIQDWSPPS